MWALARTPRWIGMLILALFIAAIFAALGQWQASRSIATGAVVERETETVVPLDSIAAPRAPMTQAADGQRVEVSGAFSDDDYLLISGRLNQGEQGWWVVGRFGVGASATDSPASDSVVVALGWAPTEEQAASALDAFQPGVATVSGRYLASDPPQDSDFENGELSQVAPPAFVNIWADFGGDVYSGYVVLDSDVAGLDLIDSPEPAPIVTVNWLNVFYAVEWAVFAGFAIFMWYRLVRDAWERQQELEAEEAEEAVRLAEAQRQPSGADLN